MGSGVNIKKRKEKKILFHIVNLFINFLVVIYGFLVFVTPDGYTLLIYMGPLANPHHLLFK